MTDYNNDTKTGETLGANPGADGTYRTRRDGDFLKDARKELAGMIDGGMGHPSTKPVLVWGGLGALAFGVLPFVGMPLGFAAGAGYKFYKRVRPD